MKFRLSKKHNHHLLIFVHNNYTKLNISALFFWKKFFIFTLGKLTVLTS